MKNKVYQYIFSFFALVAAAGCASSNLPNYRQPVANWRDVKPADSAAIRYSVLLIGDVGKPEKDPLEPSLKLMRKHLEMADTNSAAIFLGDNIYNYGLPEPGAYDRKISEERLNSQLDILKNYHGEKYMIPGNHDWAQGLEGGWQAVIRQEEYVENYLRDTAFVSGGDFYVPDGGCPGPFEVKIQDDLVLIALNSQWFLQNYDKPYGSNDGCSAVDNKDVMVQLEDIIQKNRGNHIMVVAHHPLMTDGVHGGYFTLKDHIFPISIVHKWALVPLPIIGSIYPIARSFGGVTQDISHPLYRKYINDLTAIFDKYDNVIYAAGHEHNLQYHKSNNWHHILSGSGCKTQHLRDNGKALFSHVEKGFAKVNYMTNDEVWVEFWEPKKDGTDSELVFRHKLYKKKLPPLTPVVAKAPEQTGLVQTGDVTIAANKNYDAGGDGKNFWLGLHFRKEWATPVTMPVIDIKNTNGGLVPYKIGGGKQTKSLKLRNDEGQLFTLRTINKDPSKALPSELRETVVRDILQDQISAQHPYGPLVIPKLADAAGVFHTNPKLVYIPDDPALKQYRENFRNSVAYLEEDPNENQETVASLGFAKNIVGSEKVLERLRDDNDNKVLETEFAKARLFDMLVGDWDRHAGQWRWKEEKTDKGRVYTPVPEDRDMAFFKADGVIPYLVSRKWAVRNVQDFDDNFRDVLGLNLSGLNNDRAFLSKVSKEHWLEIANGMKTGISDVEIEEAVRELPPAIYPLNGPDLVTKLKSRRDQLPDVAMQYYEVLAKHVDVVGSDKMEKFEVTRLDNNRTEVKVFKISKKGKTDDLLYQRTFDGKDTEEIRLYGLDGSDVFEVTGNANRGILVRVIGGNDPDTIRDNSRIGGLSKKTIVYDTEGDNTFAFGPETKDKTEDYIEVNKFEREGYQIPYVGPKLFFGFNPDDLFYIGGGLIYRTHKFRKAPFAAQHSLVANFAPATSSYNVRYNGIFNQVLGKYNGSLDIAYAGPQLLYNYFGIGNNTTFEEDNDIKFYRVRFSRLLVAPALTTDIFKFMKFGIGPTLDMFQIEEENSGEFLRLEAGRSITEEGQANTTDFQTNTYVGGRAFLNLVSVIDPVNPRLGVKWLNEVSSNWQIDREKLNFTNVASQFMVYFSPNFPFQLTAAYRIGGAHNFGDFRFYQANTLGGTENLRGYRRTRFAGRTSVFSNLELRAELFKFNMYLFPGRVGVLGLYDTGRVFADNEPTGNIFNGLHHGVGGGLWLEIMKRVVVVGTYSKGEEALVNVTFGFLY